MDKYKVGDIIKGKVVSIEKYGAFISVDATYSGMVHISEISDSFIRNIDDYFKIGDIIKCRVKEVDSKQKQLRLSIKNEDYQTGDKNMNIRDANRGFEPLKENLNIWINDKIKEIKD